MPPTWAGAEIILIYKKGARDLPGNYRPISLIDGLFCRQILTKIEDWMDDHNILTNCQVGFRKKTSTIDQMFRFLLIYWKTVILNKGSLYVAFIDLVCFRSYPPQHSVVCP